MAQAALIKFLWWIRYCYQYNKDCSTITYSDFDWTIKSTWIKYFTRSARYGFTCFYTLIHNTTYNTFKTSSHWPLPHNRTIIDKVTEYHNITPILFLILIEEEWEDKIHIIITKKENIPGRMIENKITWMDIYSLFSLDYEYGLIYVQYQSFVVIEFFIINLLYCRKKNIYIYFIYLDVLYLSI